MSDHMRMVGKFSIPKGAVEADPDVVMRVMEGVIVLRCEFHFVANEFHYEALHPSFDVLDVGELPPEYDCEVKEDGTVEWQRKQ